MCSTYAIYRSSACHIPSITSLRNYDKPVYYYNYFLSKTTNTDRDDQLDSTVKKHFG